MSLLEAYVLFGIPAVLLLIGAGAYVWARAGDRSHHLPGE